MVETVLFCRKCNIYIVALIYFNGCKLCVFLLWNLHICKHSKIIQGCPVLMRLIEL